MGKEVKYFNFPIILLLDFLVDHHISLERIWNYSLYAHAIKHYDIGSEKDMIASAKKFFRIRGGDNMKVWTEGLIIHDSMPVNCPTAGINTSIWFDFYNNGKSEFEKICLLAHLAIKSILGNKPYCKITNLYWFSRMDGLAKQVKNPSKLSILIGKYYTQHYIQKIKNELVDCWGLNCYARYTRGFYVSYNLSLEELAFQVEKRKKWSRDKARKKNLDEAYHAATNRLNGQ